jgi:hypothetical protein
VYNILGGEIAILVSQVKESGTHQVSFDAGKLSSGIYFCVLQSLVQSAEQQKVLVETVKMLFLK